MTGTVLITGNTYPVKDKLKALGGKWNPTANGWMVPVEHTAAAKALVATAPKSAPRPRLGHVMWGSRKHRYGST